MRHVRELTPHVVLLDATMDNGDTSRFVQTIRSTSPTARVIVMDLLAGPEDVIEFVKAGANGFVMKDATLDDLVRTIRSVAQGADVVPSALTGTLLSHIAQHVVARPIPGVEQAVRMTKRERQIMDLIAEGLSNKEIAQRLNIATYTVKSHVHNILEKLALHSRLQIAAYTHKAGGLPAAP
jgi:DNA-binding NarL/FixJ family response regulator